MSTRSYICIENEDKTFTGIYCHWDGFPGYNGNILHHFYQNRDKVKSLILLGNISHLGANVEPTLSTHSFDNPEDDVTVAYMRDRGEIEEEAKLVTLEDLDNPDNWIEYVYVFNLDNIWRFFPVGHLDEGLLNLEDELKYLEDD